MTVIEWLAAKRRTVTTSCWNCDAPQTKVGWVGWGLSFYCPSCCVGWSVLVEE